MLTTLVSLVVFFGSTFAQNSTVSLFIPAADSQSLVGSILGSDSTATTYFIQCPPGDDASNCGFPSGITLIEGPSTVHYTMNVAQEDFTATVDCILQGSSSATCTQSFGGKGANNPGVSTGILPGTDITYIPVTITAGATAGASGAASTGAASTTAASSTGPASNTSGTASQTSGPTITGASTGSSSTGNKSNTDSTSSKGAIAGSASGTATPSTAGAGRLGQAYFSGAIGALTVGLMAVL